MLSCGLFNTDLPLLATDLLLYSFLLAVGYTTNDVVYRWNKARQVAIAEDMKLSQFDLIATPSANQTDILQSGRTDVAICTFCKYSMFILF